MKKIQTVYKINRETNLAIDQVNSTTGWVVAGEGVATLKKDGTSCLWQDGKLWKRYDQKPAKQFQRLVGKSPITREMLKAAPTGFVPCQPEHDPISGHNPGWVPVSEDNPADVLHCEALRNTDVSKLVEGQTYELIGPKVRCNPYDLDQHQLYPHGSEVVEVADRSFEGLKTFLSSIEGEGLVFHHEDGRMAKIRKKDFGLSWNDIADPR